MALFQYKAMAADGTLRDGTIDADTHKAALHGLQQQALRPIAVTETVQRTDRPRAKKIAIGDLARTTSGLATLIGAGLPLDRALAITIDNIESAPLRERIVILHREVKQGTPLSEAVKAQEDAFPPTMAPMIESGEASGKLGEALARLALMLERAAKMRQTLISAMIYPAILCCIAVAVILMMMLFVVPQFQGLFDQNLDRLPATTRAILGASTLLREQGLVMLFGLVLLVLVLRGVLRRPAVRAAIDARLLDLPRVGDLIRKMETARFARVLGGLLASGVPLPPALALAQRSIGNCRMATAIAGVALRVKEGGALTPQFVATAMLPKVAISFLRTGEETATLPRMLDQLADVLDDDVSVSLGRLIGLLTPVITILMGVIIATLIGSIMTAILGFNSFALEQ